jgi:DNA-binding FadR family transcriptional regulator
MQHMQPPDKTASDSTNTSTASTSGTSATNASSSSTDSNPLAKDLSKLEEALQSGDTTSAQSILAQIMQHMQPPDKTASDSTSTSTASTSTSSTSGSNALINDLKALSEALSSGDLTSAKSAFSQVLQDIQSTGSADSTNSSTAAASDTNKTTFSLELAKLLETWTSLMATSTQASTINASA